MALTPSLDIVSAMDTVPLVLTIPSQDQQSFPERTWLTNIKWSWFRQTRYILHSHSPAFDLESNILMLQWRCGEAHFKPWNHMHFSFNSKRVLGYTFIWIIKKWRSFDSFVHRWVGLCSYDMYTARGVWAQGLGVEFMGLLYIQNIFTDCPDAAAEVFEHNFLH